MNKNNDQLRESFERDGYCVVPRVFEASECENLKREALCVLNEHADTAATVFVGAAAISAPFFDLAGDERIVSVLRALMPDGVAFLSDKIVFKSGAQNFATPWHYDASYWENTRSKISVWIALDEANANNGALKVLPQSHLRDWSHQHGDGAQTNNEFGNVVTPDWSQHDEVVCALPQGGAIIFSDRLLHASCSNTAGTDRYSIISTYHAPAEDEPLDRHFAARRVIVPKESL